VLLGVKSRTGDPRGGARIGQMSAPPFFPSPPRPLHFGDSRLYSAERICLAREERAKLSRETCNSSPEGSCACRWARPYRYGGRVVAVPG
jgi:hypothetical protein